MNAMIAYADSPGGSLVAKSRESAALIISSALLQMLFLRGEAPTSNGFAQPLPAVSTRSTPANVIEPGVTAGATAEAVLELRRLSGLTWDELAGIFGVSVRAMHHWASGNTMRAEHVGHLFTVLHIVRGLSRGSSVDVRARLLAPSAAGKTGLDLLCAADGDNADLIIAALAGAGTTTGAPQASEMQAAPLIAALSTLEDRPVRSVRTSRIAKRVRVGKADNAT